MKEYEIQVTSVTTVYVEADNEEEAFEKACEKALWEVPDSNDCVVINVTDLEDEEDE